MFNIGDPEQIYATFVDYCSGDPDGPGIPDMPVDEMSAEDLRSAVAYSLMAWAMARREEAGEEVMEIAKGYFDAAWMALIEADDDFRQRFIENKRIQVPSRDRKPYELFAKGRISEL